MKILQAVQSNLLWEEVHDDTIVVQNSLTPRYWDTSSYYIRLVCSYSIHKNSKVIRVGWDGHLILFLENVTFQFI